jgi:sugar transferase EpsL
VIGLVRKHSGGSGLYARALKRPLDVIVSLLALTLLSPLLVVIAAVILIRMGRPVLFRQVRPGLHGVPFELLKFRTMSEDRDLDGLLLSDEDRLTRLGIWLRSTSCDELPELINVVRGEMSLVGPRPWLMSYLPRYTSEQAGRMNVRPGLTGLAQVTGRNASSWSERLDLDLTYVDRITALGDLRIVIQTLVMVLSRRGISHDGHATMPEFQGEARHTDKST